MRAARMKRTISRAQKSQRKKESEESGCEDFNTHLQSV